MTESRASSAKKRKAMEARKKKRRMQAIRNRIIICATIALVAFLISFLIIKLVKGLSGGSGSVPAAEISTLTFNSDGSLIYEEIADFDEEVYSSKEFAEFVEEHVGSFNEAMGENTIVVDKLKVKDNEAYVKATYQSADSYTAFTSYNTYIGTVEEAREAGYDFSTIMVSVDQGQKGDIVEFTSSAAFDGLGVAIVKQNTRVSVPGAIRYISAHGTSIVEGTDNMVEIAPEDGNFDSTELVYIIYSLESDEENRKE